MFDSVQREAICSLWHELEAARQRSHNRGGGEDATEVALFLALNTSFKAAQETDTPQAWRLVCKANLDLRSHLRKIDVRESSFFDTLVDADDMIETALQAASNNPQNAIAYRELNELNDSLNDAQEQIRNERSRTPVWEREKRRVLTEGEQRFEEGKRHIHVLSGNQLTIHVDFEGLVAGIKELVEVVEKGVKLARDHDLGNRVKRAAERVWHATKRFTSATKQRFAALRLPWRKTTADDSGEGIGRIFQDLDVGPEMVVIPPGSFWMGSHKSNGDDAETPKHKVTLPHAIAVGRFPVTFEEWDFAQADKEWAKITGLEPRKPNDRGWGRNRRPVIDVSWEDAQAYIRWLSHKTAKHYRLLSEAEWEYACRAGSDTAYCFGDDEKKLGDYAWYDRNAAQQTHAVGEKRPNAFGLYDMHGNVWEWCEDVSHNYKDKTEKMKATGEAWTADDSSRHVIRGGSWLMGPRGLRATYRYGDILSGRSNGTSFRVARSL